MLRIGEKQTLIVVKEVDFGVYLAEKEGDEDKVLLPKKQVPEGAKKGTSIEVFLYRDSEDRLIATTAEPKMLLNQTAVLSVVSIGKVGAFLDWGLEKDLFLPYKEQTKALKPQDEVLAALYVDKSGRLCATMKVYKYLKKNAPYQIGDTLKARVYDVNPRFGVFAAVEDIYTGLIPKKEAQGKYHVGDVIEVRITKVHEDGKLELSAHKKAYQQLLIDAEMIRDRLEEYGGVLMFDDRTTPEVIEAEFGISKAAFKRAVGHLLKEKMITIGDGEILLN